MMQILTTNAITVILAVEKKLPNGEKNIKRILVKTTMGPNKTSHTGKEERFEMRKNSTVFPAKKMHMYKQATELPKK